MASESQPALGRRERQIMDIVFRRGQVSVAEVRVELPDPPSYSAVRAMLAILEDKGHLRHEQDGLRYIYRPVMDAAHARAAALKHMVRTFFGGAPEKAVAALLQMSDTKLSTKDKHRLIQSIKKAKQEGR